MEILIVDDDELTRHLLTHTLTKAGYEVRPTCNGREALEILREGSSRMVISDWMMPEMDGIDLCRAIRNGDFNDYIYVILLTSRGQTEDIVEGLSAEADDFVRKPFHPAELLMRVRAGERVLALETRDLTIFALAKLAESRDEETGAHLERMRRYSWTIAQGLLETGKLPSVVDAEYVRMIFLTSPLHDIGKVGIPDGILLKPGPLSASEYQIMKQHTIIGAETISAALAKQPSAKFLHIARDIIISHHEHFDGSGYPYGLAGYDIPLSGRIAALADVYDALTSKRIYKEAYSHDLARSLILKGSGSQFDPAIIEVFLRKEGRFRAIHDQFERQNEEHLSRTGPAREQLERPIGAIQFMI
jgi:putative two-component system response regulator